MESKANLAAVIAANAKYLMREQGRYDNPNALATAMRASGAKASPNSVAYIFKPNKRPAGETFDTLPRLEILAETASALQCSTWELLHPNLIELREKMAAYEAMAKTIDRSRGRANVAPLLSRRAPSKVGEGA